MRCQQASANCLSVPSFFSRPGKLSGVKYFSSQRIQTGLRKGSSVSRKGAGTGLITDTLNVLSLREASGGCLGRSPREGCRVGRERTRVQWARVSAEFSGQGGPQVEGGPQGS